MSKTPSQRLTRSNSNPNSNITLQDIKSLIENTKTQLLGKLSVEINKLSDMLTTLIARIDNLDKKSKEIEKQCSESHAVLDEKIKELKCSYESSMEEMMLEMEQRNQRSGNVIIFGLPESNEGTAEERKTCDSKAVDELLIKIDVNIPPTQAHRLGKPRSSKPRPLRVSGLNRSEKFAILRKAKSLRQYEKYRNVFINPDLTRRQQNEASILRAELKQRKENGEHDLIIRNGKIIPSSAENFH